MEIFYFIIKCKREELKTLTLLDKITGIACQDQWMISKRKYIGLNNIMHAWGQNHSTEQQRILKCCADIIQCSALLMKTE